MKHKKGWLITWIIVYSILTISFIVAGIYTLKYDLICSIAMFTYALAFLLALITRILRFKYEWLRCEEYIKLQAIFNELEKELQDSIRKQDEENKNIIE